MNKKMTLKDKIKDNLESGKYIYKVLSSYPVILGICIVLFVLGIYGDIKGLDTICITLYLIGMIFIIAILALIIDCIKNPGIFISKFFVFALLWFASCVILVDFSQFSLLLLFKIITAFEFIFLGCIMPEFVSEATRIRNENIAKKASDNAIGSDDTNNKA